MKASSLLCSAVLLSVTLPVLSRGDEPTETGARPVLLSQEDLQKRLADPALRLIDARPKAAYDQGHIPGAVWWDPKVFEPLTRGEALQDRAAWGRLLASLGVGSDSEVFVYDDDRYHLAAGRTWFWLSYALGVRTVGLIDGRFSDWEEAKRPSATEETRINPREVEVTFRPSQLASRQDVQTATLLRTYQLVDARSEGEYVGTGVCPISKKPLPGGRAGHLPSARLLASEKVVSDSGRFLDESALRALLSQAEIAPDRPTIVYAKGGARSNAVVFALRRLGLPVRHYIPGLNEWAADPQLPLVTGSEPGRRD